MHLRIGFLLFAFGIGASAAPLDDALALLKENKSAEARTALAAIVEKEPENARAHLYLAQAIMMSGDAKRLDDALPHAERAAILAPRDVEILTAYGQLCMQNAAVHTSIGSARKGREAIEDAIKIDPENLQARETLYMYYKQAPWPLGSSSKASEQLEEIRKRDARRAFVISINAMIGAKQYAEIFRACDELLAKDPNDALALFNYGRAAATSGQNTERGIECLQKYIAMAPQFRGAPSLGNAWGRIGVIHQKLGHSEEARAAYRKTLELEPNNKVAAAALASVK